MMEVIKYLDGLFPEESPIKERCRLFYKIFLDDTNLVLSYFITNTVQTTIPLSNDDILNIQARVKTYEWYTDDLLSVLSNMISGKEPYLQYFKDMEILESALHPESTILYEGISPDVSRAFMIHERVDEESCNSAIDTILYNYSRILFDIETIFIRQYVYKNKVSLFEGVLQMAYTSANTDVMSGVKQISEILQSWR
jgi:hypothetical protein